MKRIMAKTFPDDYACISFVQAVNIQAYYYPPYLTFFSLTTSYQRSDGYIISLELKTPNNNPNDRRLIQKVS